MKSYVISTILAVLSTASISTVLTFTTKDNTIQNAHCKSLESPALLNEMKPIIRRDCIGELDRAFFSKSFFTLLPIFLFVLIMFNYYYENK
jgi:hypothetical protein